MRPGAKDRMPRLKLFLGRSCLELKRHFFEEYQQLQRNRTHKAFYPVTSARSLPSNLDATPRVGPWSFQPRNFSHPCWPCHRPIPFPVTMSPFSPGPMRHCSTSWWRARLACRVDQVWIDARKDFPSQSNRCSYKSCRNAAQPKRPWAAHSNRVLFDRVSFWADSLSLRGTGLQGWFPTEDRN